MSSISTRNFQVGKHKSSCLLSRANILGHSPTVKTAVTNHCDVSMHCDSEVAGLVLAANTPGSPWEINLYLEVALSGIKQNNTYSRSN